MIEKQILDIVSKYENELVELTSMNGDWGTYPTMKVRKKLLNEAWRRWLKEFHTLTPRQADHIRRIIALALFDKEGLRVGDEVMMNE